MVGDQEEFVGAPPQGADDAPGTSIDSMTFEVALSELESIVQKLERGQLDLDQSIEAYERGTRLRQHCDSKLRDARLRVEKLVVEDGDKVRLEEMEASPVDRA